MYFLMIWRKRVYHNEPPIEVERKLVKGIQNEIQRVRNEINGVKHFVIKIDTHFLHSVTNLMTLEYKIPRLLWENFESVLLAQSKRYIAELAKRLGVPERELMKRVLPHSDSLKVIIQDSHSETNQCKAYVQQDKLTIFCKKPVAYQSDFCPLHRNKRMMVIEETTPIVVQKVRDCYNMESMWIQENHLIDSTGSIVGKIKKSEQVIKRFVIQPVEVPKSSNHM